MKNNLVWIPYEEYEGINAINYSLLKTVADSGRLYSRKKKVEGRALSLGSVVENLVLPTEATADEKYYITKNNAPTASLLNLANDTIKHCRENNLSYADLIRENEKNDLVFNILKEKGYWSTSKEDTKRDKYKNDIFWDYVKGKLSPNLSMDMQTWEKANELAHVLKTHKHTKEIFKNGVNQLSYVFEINGITYKIRFDKITIDDKAKEVTAYDLKTGEAAAHKFEFNFYKFRYYLQQDLYQLGALHYVDHHLPGYKLNDFKFIYISTSEPDPYPVIYTMSEDWAELGWNGFYKGNKYYKGIKELTEEYLFYEKKGNSVERNIYLGGGELEFPLPQ